MGNIMRRIMGAEFRSAATKHYKLDLWLTFIFAVIFTIFSFTAYDAGWAGLFFAVIFFWHRYVVLNISRNCPDVMRAISGQMINLKQVDELASERSEES
ncbi:MAG: hypothetical protein WD071_09280 [Pseudohongiella sp.]|uniref:hypothetical protein n=1 Tax=Pseudohongiella sp. TaxID=1979412 RepID=UPI0034A06096